MQEVFEKDGYIYTAERKAIFMVKEQRSFKDGHLAGQWILDRINDPDDPKQVSILRVCNKHDGDNLWRSRLTGRLYVMRNNTVLTIAFLQIFKLTITQGQLSV